jgi:hypothetical protein
MLIVIVIIGILIAALMPRMQAAQWRARDVSRKTALSQIQSAIVVSQWDKWAWPGMTGNKDDTLSTGADMWIDVWDIETQLKSAWMNSIPTDPLGTTVFSWVGDWQWAAGQYRYIVTTRNGTSNWWFVLMAKTEVEWWSNWVVCDNDEGMITWGTDLGKILTCEGSLTETGVGGCSNNSTWSCLYENSSQLRYIVLY